MCDFLYENMNFTPELRAFLRQHNQDDPTKLLLSGSRYPDIDVRWVAEQLMARKQIRQKLPEWYAKADELIMGGRVPAEQCSSEQTARYKRQLVAGDSLCDMTGGMGVDCYYMSRGLQRAIYTERQMHLCEAARNNFMALGADNIEVREGDGRELPIPDVETIYLDPARRAGDGSRVYDIAGCEPNVVEWRHELMKHCRRLVVKLSPMADIARLLQQMPETIEVHVIGVRNECKEIVAVLEEGNTGPARIVCVDFRTSDILQFVFTADEEHAAEMMLADMDAQMRFLYEPDVTLLKAGVFRLPCKKWGVRKLDANSHFYVSDTLIEDFPGRIFNINEIMPFSSKLIKTLKTRLPQANIATRNFVLTSDELRKRSGIRDGGNDYLFGTTSHNHGQLLLLCRKCLLVILMLMCLMDVASAKKKKKAVLPTVDDIVAGVKLQSPGEWVQGMPFIYQYQTINQTLVPEVPEASVDTTDYSNTLWTFDGIVSEEDWMGQQLMSLRFRSPQNRMYRIVTGRLMSQLDDTTYHPALPGLLALDPVLEVDALLKGRQFYLMLNDERVLTADSVRLEKFVPVTVDSVTIGMETAPLCVWFSHPKGISASFMSSLPDSRESTTSSPLSRFLSVTDPYEKYPDIKPEDWQLIRNNQLRQGMTFEEVRLSWGRPQRFERITTKGGLMERWHYQDRRLLEFRDGRLIRIAFER